MPIDASHTYQPLLTTRLGVFGNDQYTKLLLHMQGADGAAKCGDSSRGGHAVTCHGNAQIDTAQSVFLGSSLLLDGNGDYLSIPDSADWFMDTGKFTIDFYVRFSDLPAGASTIFTQAESAFDRAILWYDPLSNIGFRFNIDVGSVTKVYLTQGSADAVVDTWYHIALIRGWEANSNKWAICVDGTVIATVIKSDAWPDLAASFIIGGAVPVANYMAAQIDEFRVSKGVARWTANFTPPTMQYR